MTDMEIKYGHDVRAPWDEALALKVPAGMRDPHLFAERLGNRCLLNFRDHLYSTEYGVPHATHLSV